MGGAGPDVLALAVVVVDHLGDPHGGDAFAAEFGLFAAAADPVPAQHDQGFQALHEALAGALQVAGQLPAVAVVLGPQQFPDPPLAVALLGRHAVGEQPCGRGVLHPGGALGVAHAVGRHHAQDGDAVGLEPLHQPGAAQQPLLARRRRHEVDVDRRPLRGQDRGRLQGRRHPAGVVHRPRRVGAAVQGVRGAAVVVRHQHQGLVGAFRVRPGQHDPQVDQVHRLGQPRPGPAGKPVLEGDQARARELGERLELAAQPLLGRADAAGLRGRIGEGVAGPEGGQAAHGPGQPGRLHPPGQVLGALHRPFLGRQPHRQVQGQTDTGKHAHGNSGVSLHPTRGGRRHKTWGG